MKTSIIFGCALLVATSVANAQMSPNMAMPKSASAPSAGAAVMTDGVVESVDRSKGVVTLKHGDITNMGMPGMTMAFNVSDKKMLDKIKTGDKVRFHVEKISGAPTVTRIEATQ